MAEPRRSAQIVDAAVAGARLLIVEARFYDGVADMLLAGAQAACLAAQCEFDVETVPGALELAGAIAIAVEAARSRGRPYDGAVALGCVVRGETYHFEIVSNESARGLTDFALRERFPIGNGVLTVENDEQAIVRADPAAGDKGGDAVRAALTLVSLQRRAGRV
jgi:6,7-dimethyl-8-ribityllumazine synthase